jgi:geranylgeranyl reductase family protein
MRISCHIAIVGAGPAGATAATLLTRAGAKVILLEKAHFPRDKTCGDGCSPRMLHVLKKLGLGDLPVSEAQSVRAFYCRSPSGRILDADIPEELFGGRACAIPRMVLDEHLVKIAVQAGAELREGVQVDAVEISENIAKIRCKNGGVIHADVILGCDGSPSVVRRALGAPTFASHLSAFAVRAYYKNVNLTRPNSFGLFWEREFLPHFAWIFPLPNGGANVGIGMRADKLEQNSNKLPALLERFCESSLGQQELKGAHRVGKIKGHHLPFGSTISNITFNRALLLGDAAGFINPLTGEGIELAMESAQFATEAILEADRVGDFSKKGFESYERRCRERFEIPFLLNGRLMQMFEKPKLIDRVCRAAQRSKRLQLELGKIMVGESKRLPLRLLIAAALGI